MPTSCKQSRLVQRFVVENSEVLESEPWQLHLRNCPACRDEVSAFGRTLAVFCQVESERREQKSVKLSWEQFATVLAEERTPAHPARVRLSITAAAAAVLVAAGSLLWLSDQPMVPEPAKIVNLQPEQRSHLHRILKNSLAEAVPVRYVLKGQNGNALAEAVGSNVLNTLGEPFRPDYGAKPKALEINLTNPAAPAPPRVVPTLNIPRRVRGSQPLVRTLPAPPAAEVMPIQSQAYQIPTR